MPLPFGGRPQDILKQMAGEINLAKYLDESELQEIGHKVKEDHDRDDASMQEWLRTHDEVLDLAMQVAKKKTTPWVNASNVIYPLITTAAIQYASRAYPALIPNEEPVKVVVVGDDTGKDGQEPGTKKKRSERVKRHLSYQLIRGMPYWRWDLKKILMYQSIVGFAIREVYWDTVNNVPLTEFVPADQFVINKNSPSIEAADGYGVIFWKYSHQVTENIREGKWLATPDTPEDEVDPIAKPEGGHDDGLIEFVKRYCRYDLDEDGYPEPLVVTFRVDNGKVVRVEPGFRPDNIVVNRRGRVVRVERNQTCVKYPFIPAFDGSFFDIGFGFLLRNLNRSINTLINQIIDAGKLSNGPSGFLGRGARLRGGNFSFKPGEFKVVDMTGDDLNKSIYEFKFNGPSPVLFQMLGLLIDSAKDITSVKDIMTGETDKNLAPTTIMKLAEEGAKVFNYIYDNVHQSLTEELQLLFRLNREYLQDEDYVNTLNEPEAIAKTDYEGASMDVYPTTDPRMATEQSKQAYMMFLSSLGQSPVINQSRLMQMLTDLSGFDIPPDLIMDKPPPDPKAEAAAIKARNDMARIMIAASEARGKVAEMYSNAILNLAKAESEEAGRQFEQYKLQLENLGLMLDAVTQSMSGAMGGVEGGTGNPTTTALPPELQQILDTANPRAPGPTTGAARGL